MILYLSIPIDRNAAAQDQYKLVTNELMRLAHDRMDSLTIFRPGPAFMVHRVTLEGAQYVMAVNEYALQEADACMLVHNPGLETWGCPQEMFFCSLHQTPCAIWSPLEAGKTPLYMLGSGLPICDTIEDAYNSLLLALSKGA